MRAIYPGSFDPVTNGHLNIIQRAAKLCDVLIVAVLNNPSKITKFSAEERTAMLKEACQNIPNVEIKAFDGLLVDFAQKQNVKIIIKGTRSSADFEYELQMAQLNKELNPNIETFFMPADVNYSHISSSAVKTIADFGGDIGFMVPASVLKTQTDKTK